MVRTHRAGTKVAAGGTQWVWRIADSAWVADNAVLIGNVELDDASSIWFGAVLRGDNEPLVIGRRSNVQDASVLHTDIDFAAYLAGSSLKVYEGGASKGTFGTLAVGDVVKVAVQGGTVRYYLNNALVYTSTLAPTYPLLLDTAINSLGGKVYNAYICAVNSAKR